jgi:hypothetical protein
MGGDLPPTPEDATAPSFMVIALRDPDGANLDRIQIVKGWVDGDGRPQTKVFDVPWSGDREPGGGRQAAAGRRYRYSCGPYKHHRRGSAGWVLGRSGI